MYLLIIIFFKSEFMAAQRARPILHNERFLVIVLAMCGIRTIIIVLAMRGIRTIIIVLAM